MLNPGQTQEIADQVGQGSGVRAGRGLVEGSALVRHYGPAARELHGFTGRVQQEEGANQDNQGGEGFSRCVEDLKVSTCGDKGQAGGGQGLASSCEDGLGAGVIVLVEVVAFVVAQGPGGFLGSDQGGGQVAGVFGHEKTPLGWLPVIQARRRMEQFPERFEPGRARVGRSWTERAAGWFLPGHDVSFLRVAKLTYRLRQISRADACLLKLRTRGRKALSGPAGVCGCRSSRGLAGLPGPRGQTVPSRAMAGEGPQNWHVRG